jgi:transcriptional regulator with XRE-family HTH domain
VHTHPTIQVLRGLAATNGFTHAEASGKRFSRGDIKVTELAAHLGIRQATLSRLITGDIKEPSLQLLLAMRDKFKVSVDQALGLQPLESTISPATLAFCTRWEDMPPALQNYIRNIMDSFDVFAAQNSLLADLMFTTPPRTEYPEIEAYQKKHQKPRMKK